MFGVFMDALKDTAGMIPFLLVIYIGIEFIEFKFGGKIGEKVKHAGKAGPLIGAAFGCVPQCGFSVISTALYTKKLISLGTLLAVYLSTSDEAVPVILAQPDKIGIILPLILTKIVIAVIAGYTIDFVLNKLGKSVAEGEICAVSEENFGSKDHEDDHGNNSDDPINEKGCCGHSCISEKPNMKELFLHPVVHTAKVFIFIFAVSMLINLIIYKIGEENLGSVFLEHSILQPVVAALVGLIPNCAASVAITQVFLKGGLSFGSTVAGLSASAGLGMLVLFKENKSMKDTVTVIGLLLGISIVAGIGIQLVLG